MARAVLQPVELPSQTRLMVPVMASVGGSGRSVVAGLLADAFAPNCSSLVLDTVPRLLSPWHGWVDRPGAGLSTLPPDGPARRGQVRTAAAAGPASGPRGWQVMTDHRPWNSAPLPLPEAPEAWHQLGALGDWQAVIADTGHPFAHDVIASRHSGRAGLSARWCSVYCAVPVLCAAATGAGAEVLQTAVKAAEADALPVGRMTVALVATSDGRLPPAVKAAATMLEPRVGAIVHIPYDSRVRSHGLRDSKRLGSRTLMAGHELADAVVNLAKRAWGDVLPPAARPAPLMERTPRVPHVHAVGR